ncbi:hypothetical protein HDEF_0362 [Candidatus Hamiltonella defensa 5AT (Acyrthosiphon pisum)]|uniref:Uncharacterized protein n=1 Tax=Hamiltonella defensa subsp. Acyrthosiphon pisum (strain 5AT) TaxID=572265 RepID=C4K3H7_HAMD5|nr:hypothetical protein HDEF_0362 [Candidatus Hamiltonella defensa 5AT (Acyrthosiphon pisum)]
MLFLMAKNMLFRIILKNFFIINHILFIKNNNYFTIYFLG